MQFGHIVNKICKEPDTANAFEDFIEDCVDAEEFMDYFKATWYPRIGTLLLKDKLLKDKYM